MFIFQKTWEFYMEVSLLHLSAQTEASSAGEQLARDRQMTDKNVNQWALYCAKSIDIFRGLYALKNSLISLTFLACDSPL